MTWLYVVVAGAVVVRWGLWYLRDVIEWMDAPRSDYVSSAMLARLRLRREPGRAAARIPVLYLSEGVFGGHRGA